MIRYGNVFVLPLRRRRGHFRDAIGAITPGRMHVQIAFE